MEPEGEVRREELCANLFYRLKVNCKRNLTTTQAQDFFLLSVHNILLVTIDFADDSARKHRYVCMNF